MMADHAYDHDGQVDHMTAEKRKELCEDSRPDCFYDLCKQSSSCFYGWLVCGYFKNPKHLTQCILFSIMITSLFIAIILPLVLYKLADDGINESVVIDNENAPSYEVWQTNAAGEGLEHVSVHYNVYLFDIQNAEEAIQGERPVLVEVGPYAYDEYYNKIDISWTDHGDTVSYRTQKYYVFNQARTDSGLTEQDKLTLPYATAIGFAYLLSEVPANITDMVDAFVNDELVGLETNFTREINQLYEAIDDSRLPDGIKAREENRIKDRNATVHFVFDRMFAFTERSNASSLLLKVLLCGIDNDAGNGNMGISPFWKASPADAWYGWLNDPILLEMQSIFDKMLEKNPGSDPIPWTSGVPGIAFNHTSVHETRRKSAPDTFKTGKKNPHQAFQYVKYENMSSVWACVDPMASQNTSLYEEGVQFAMCENFQNEWTDEEAEGHGYAKPFATDYANRIEGTDANGFGRPVTNEKMQIYISDIYRSAYLLHESDENWDGIWLNRYKLQPKDLENATVNPENAQYYNFAPSGMENTTAAVGAPVFVSFPHFLHADSRLVAAVQGLNPDELVHGSYLDIEPQTGLLARVEKRLQVNYQISDYHMPTSEPDSLSLLQASCADLSRTIKVLNKFDIFSKDIDEVDCNLTASTKLFTCLAQPSDWKFQNGEIFFPYGWVEEGMALSDEDADDLNTQLFDLDRVAYRVRFWSLIAAGICFAALLSMHLASYLDNTNELLNAHPRLSAYKEEQRLSDGTCSQPLLRPDGTFTSQTTSSITATNTSSINNRPTPPPSAKSSATGAGSGSAVATNSPLHHSQVQDGQYPELVTPEPASKGSFTF